MKIVVYGPERRVGVLHNAGVVDACYAFAKYLRETVGERYPLEHAQAIAPSDLARFIEGGRRALDNTQKALDHLFGKAADRDGIRGEKIVYQPNEVKIHAPRPANARIACAGGNFADHAGAMAARTRGGADVAPAAADYAASIRKMGIWGFTLSCARALGRYGVTANSIGPAAATRMTASIPTDRANRNWTEEPEKGGEMDPANIAPPLVYLASDEGAHISGRCFGISGMARSKSAIA